MGGKKEIESLIGRLEKTERWPIICHSDAVSGAIRLLYLVDCANRRPLQCGRASVAFRIVSNR